MPNLIFDQKLETTLQTSPLFRVSDNVYSPTSIVGSLADGARMNIGGSQSGPFVIQSLGE